MSKQESEYSTTFDLAPEELSLHILVCSQKSQETSLPQVVFIEPKALPKLAFADQSFDLALCDHVLLVANPNLTAAFQEEALIELCRVASEVRVYPLVDKQGVPSVYLGTLLQALQERGIGVELKQISRGENKGQALLRVWNATCETSKNASREHLQANQRS